MARSTIQSSLIRLLLGTIVLVLLISACFTHIDQDLRAPIIVLVVVVAFPVTLLLGVDASRVIKREMPNHKKLRVLGRVLALPQAVLGTVLVAFSLIYPIFGIRQILNSAQRGGSILPAFGIAIAAFGFGLGVHYIREGLDIKHRGES